MTNFHRGDKVRTLSGNVSATFVRYSGRKQELSIIQVGPDTRVVATTDLKGYA